MSRRRSSRKINGKRLILIFQRDYCPENSYIFAPLVHQREGKRGKGGQGTPSLLFESTQMNEEREGEAPSLIFKSTRMNGGGEEGEGKEHLS